MDWRFDIEWSIIRGYNGIITWTFDVSMFSFECSWHYVMQQHNHSNKNINNFMCEYVLPASHNKNLKDSITCIWYWYMYWYSHKIDRKDQSQNNYQALFQQELWAHQAHSASIQESTKRWKRNKPDKEKWRSSESAEKTKFDKAEINIHERKGINLLPS